ncbi:heterokaryon incompatibility [Colletotrichum incanum]|uniref:Heterokaryon incompatibility n=1 Tax=Colletotrichum incanum TaxID=1573173 RepID=A0A162MYQ1_COLIC|nr:heterokaryon incompatibility [Colletotrichum incanum]
MMSMQPASTKERGSCKKDSSRHEQYTSPILGRRGTKKFFEVDPKFPNRLRSSGFAITWEFLRALLENYTQRGITESSDRAIAISGLMARVKKVLPCPIHHVIIDWYLRRSLLCKTAKGDKRKKINYKMDYRVLPDEFGTLDRFGHLAFDKTTLTTTIWEFIDPGTRNVTESGDVSHQIFDSNGSLQGWIILDEEREIFFSQNVVILSRIKGDRTEEYKYYVLFVQLRKQDEWYQGQEHSREVGFERIGIGMLQECCSLRNTGEGHIF